MKTCCPSGYFYNASSRTCVTISGLSVNVPSVDCPCCPKDGSGNQLTYIDSNGYFYNRYTATSMQIISALVGSPVADFYGKCALTQSAPVAYGFPFNPIACPCCPSGYAWDDSVQLCIGIANPLMQIEPIPCIVCDCPEPVPPPPCIGCTVQTLPITFNFNENIRQYANCNPDTGEPVLAPWKSFIADRLIAPIINFIRK